MDILLEHQGWIRHPVGYYISNNEIKEIEGFFLYIREREFGNFLKKSPIVDKEIVLKRLENTTFLPIGSKHSMGDPVGDLTPTSSALSAGSSALVELSNFSEFQALNAIRTNTDSLVIAFDSEWENINADTDRDMLTWQFALIKDNQLIEFIFLKMGNEDLSIELALAAIFDYLNLSTVDTRTITRYKYCSEFKNQIPVVKITDDINEANSAAIYVCRDGKFTNELIQDMPDKYKKRSERNWSWYNKYYDYSKCNSIKVTIVCHAGKADLSSFSKNNYKSSMLRRTLTGSTEVQGGLVSLQPIRIAPRSKKNNKIRHENVYPVSLSIRDTMCHAPADQKSLLALGKVVGINKIEEVTEDDKEHMRTLLYNNPVLFFEYASSDAVVTLLYSAALYGYNKAMPVTITSATAGVMKDSISTLLKIEEGDDFNLTYRGLKRVGHGLVPREDRPGYLESTSLEPITNIANTIQYYASQAYHGGYNCCTEVGYFPYQTFDYDLMNAYPTAMCLVPDIDWKNPARVHIQRRYLELSDWVGVGGVNPVTPFVGYVRFEFPTNVKYTSIPVNDNGIPVYPRKFGSLESADLNGVYVAGPYVYLALKLGAKVWCEDGYFIRTLYEDDSYTVESRSLSKVVKQLVVDRVDAKDKYGKGSLEEQILKVMVNSGYGKIAQDVIDKRSWSAKKNEMVDVGCSSITNPVAAMMITSIVQCVLIAAQNEIDALGYMSCSVTTDGFISNVPMEVLEGLDLMGFKKFIATSRLFLSGSEVMWDDKHKQDDLVNFCTRGNVSLIVEDKELGIKGGVCAHNSSKSGYESDSYEDRLWLMTSVLSRRGPVYYTTNEWTSFRDIVDGKPFTVEKVGRNVRMDFDMKRKPVKESFTTDTVIVNGVSYEMAHFDTVPFEDVDEFRRYRAKKELTSVLRTIDDWKIFWMKLDLDATGAKVRDLDWAIINSCIMGCRAGRWAIPALEGLSVVEKCNWINSYNDSNKKFKESDWKNARRPDRQVNMLPLHLLTDKLIQMGVNI